MTGPDVGLAAMRAGAFLVGLLVLYPPVALLERWARLPPGERERFGLRPLAPLTDVLKLLGKRAAVPAGADRLMHRAAPFFALTPSLILLALLPPGPPVRTAAGGVIELGVVGSAGTLLLALALLIASSAGIALAGWAGADPLAHLGGVRLFLVRVSACVVVVLGCAGVARAHQTVDLNELVILQGQSLIGALPALGLCTSPLGFGCALVALAVLNQRGFRTRPERNADLVEPHAAAASGPTFLVHRAFEVVDLLAAAALLSCVFLGGWIIPGVDVPEVAAGFSAEPLVALSRVGVFMGKTLLMAGALLLLRRALPALRHDQAIRLTWSILLPLATLGLIGSDVLAGVWQ